MVKAVLVGDDGSIVDPETGQPRKKSDFKPKKNEEVEEKKEIKDKNFEKKTYSKYEVKPDTFFYIKFGIVFHNDRVSVINEDDAEYTKEAEKHWVKFRMWNYGEELDWKNKSTEYNTSKRMHMLNADQLNEMKIRNLLLDWSFGEKDSSLKILHVNSVVSDEGLKIFYSLYPTIVRHIVEEMNVILEHNG